MIHYTCGKEHRTYAAEARCGFSEYKTRKLAGLAGEGRFGVLVMVEVKFHTDHFKGARRHSYHPYILLYKTEDELNWAGASLSDTVWGSFDFPATTRSVTVVDEVPITLGKRDEK